MGMLRSLKGLHYTQGIRVCKYEELLFARLKR